MKRTKKQRQSAQKENASMSNGNRPNQSWAGPTTCKGDETGNFMHQNWVCVNGKPMFYVTGWSNTDGSYTAVPADQQMPGASSPVVPGTTIVQNGTLWVFDPTNGYVDTGEPAAPLVVIDSSGNVTSPGYNPGTGGWQVGQNPDGSAVYGIAPTNAKQIPGAYDQLQAAVQAVGQLIGVK